MGFKMKYSEAGMFFGCFYILAQYFFLSPCLVHGWSDLVFDKFRLGKDCVSKDVEPIELDPTKVDPQPFILKDELHFKIPLEKWPNKSKKGWWPHDHYHSNNTPEDFGQIMNFVIEPTGLEDAKASIGGHNVTVLLAVTKSLLSNKDNKDPGMLETVYKYTHCTIISQHESTQILQVSISTPEITFLSQNYDLKTLNIFVVNTGDPNLTSKVSITNTNKSIEIVSHCYKIENPLPGTYCWGIDGVFLRNIVQKISYKRHDKSSMKKRQMLLDLKQQNHGKNVIIEDAQCNISDTTCEKNVTGITGGWGTTMHVPNLEHGISSNPLVSNSSDAVELKLKMTDIIYQKYSLTINPSDAIKYQEIGEYWQKYFIDYSGSLYILFSCYDDCFHDLFLKEWRLSAREEIHMNLIIDTTVDIKFRIKPFSRENKIKLPNLTVSDDFFRNVPQEIAFKDVMKFHPLHYERSSSVHFKTWWLLEILCLDNGGELSVSLSPLSKRQRVHTWTPLFLQRPDPLLYKENKDSRFPTYYFATFDSAPHKLELYTNMLVTPELFVCLSECHSTGTKLGFCPGMPAGAECYTNDYQRRFEGKMKYIKASKYAVTINSADFQFRPNHYYAVTMYSKSKVHNASLQRLYSFPFEDSKPSNLAYLQNRIPKFVYVHKNRQYHDQNKFFAYDAAVLEKSTRKYILRLEVSRSAGKCGIVLRSPEGGTWGDPTREVGSSINILQYDVDHLKKMQHPCHGEDVFQPNVCDVPWNVIVYALEKDYCECYVTLSLSSDSLTSYYKSPRRVFTDKPNGAVMDLAYGVGNVTNPRVFFLPFDLYYRSLTISLLAPPMTSLSLCVVKLTYEEFAGDHAMVALSKSVNDNSLTCDFPKKNKQNDDFTKVITIQRNLNTWTEVSLNGNNQGSSHRIDAEHSYNREDIAGFYIVIKKQNKMFSPSYPPDSLLNIELLAAYNTSFDWLPHNTTLRIPQKGSYYTYFNVNAGSANIYISGRGYGKVGLGVQQRENRALFFQSFDNYSIDVLSALDTEDLQTCIHERQCYLQIKFDYMNDGLMEFITSISSSRPLFFNRTYDLSFPTKEEEPLIYFYENIPQTKFILFDFGHIEGLPIVEIHLVPYHRVHKTKDFTKNLKKNKDYFLDASKPMLQIGPKSLEKMGDPECKIGKNEQPELNKDSHQTIFHQCTLVLKIYSGYGRRSSASISATTYQDNTNISIYLSPNQPRLLTYEENNNSLAYTLLFRLEAKDYEQWKSRQNSFYISLDNINGCAPSLTIQMNGDQYHKKINFPSSKYVLIPEVPPTNYRPTYIYIYPDTKKKACTFDIIAGFHSLEENGVNFYRALLGRQQVLNFNVGTLAVIRFSSTSIQDNDRFAMEIISEAGDIDICVSHENNSYENEIGMNPDGSCMNEDENSRILPQKADDHIFRVKFGGGWNDSSKNFRAENLKARQEQNKAKNSENNGRRLSEVEKNSKKPGRSVTSEIPQFNLCTNQEKTNFSRISSHRCTIRIVIRGSSNAIPGSLFPIKVLSWDAQGLSYIHVRPGHPQVLDTYKWPSNSRYCFFTIGVPSIAFEPTIYLEVSGNGVKITDSLLTISSQVFQLISKNYADNSNKLKVGCESNGIAQHKACWHGKNVPYDAIDKNKSTKAYADSYNVIHAPKVEIPPTSLLYLGVVLSTNVLPSDFRFVITVEDENNITFLLNQDTPTRFILAPNETKEFAYHATLESYNIIFIGAILWHKELLTSIAKSRDLTARAYEHAYNAIVEGTEMGVQTCSSVIDYDQDWNKPPIPDIYGQITVRDSYVAMTPNMWSGRECYYRILFKSKLDVPITMSIGASTGAYTTNRIRFDQYMVGFISSQTYRLADFKLDKPQLPIIARRTQIYSLHRNRKDPVRVYTVFENCTGTSYMLARDVYKGVSNIKNRTYSGTFIHNADYTEQNDFEIRGKKFFIDVVLGKNCNKEGNCRESELKQVSTQSLYSLIVSRSENARIFAPYKTSFPTYQYMYEPLNQQFTKIISKRKILLEFPKIVTSLLIEYSYRSVETSSQRLPVTDNELSSKRNGWVLPKAGDVIYEIFYAPSKFIISNWNTGCGLYHDYSNRHLTFTKKKTTSKNKIVIDNLDIDVPYTFAIIAKYLPEMHSGISTVPYVHETLEVFIKHPNVPGGQPTAGLNPTSTGSYIFMVFSLMIVVIGFIITIRAEVKLIKHWQTSRIYDLGRDVDIALTDLSDQQTQAFIGKASDQGFHFIAAPEVRVIQPLPLRAAEYEVGETSSAFDFVKSPQNGNNSSESESDSALL